MNTAITSVLAWAKRNERHLSSLFFLGGFIGDILTFTLLEVSIVNLIFAVYLVLGALAILVSHYLFSHHKENENRLVRALSILSPLFVQYAIGSILSGSLIFYTKSATLLVSWPFLLLIAVVFFGNELFRSYREHLAFQTTLFFFGFYAYIIFALPLVVGTIGPNTFIESSIIAGGAFAGFLFLLFLVGKKRFSGSIGAVIGGSLFILASMNAAYFTGVIPPLPLGLKDAGIYQSVTRTPRGYEVTGEEARKWWEVYKPNVVHHIPGTPLYAYSAVFAPIKFTAGVLHVWEWYDEEAHSWVVKNKVPFPVSGGRAEGYRGYSEKSDPQAGTWRVSIKTGEGQTIGRTTFSVVTVPTLPQLTTEVR